MTRLTGLSLRLSLRLFLGLFLGVVVGGFAGCGRPHASISRELRERLSRDDHLAIYDRENDVVIAETKRDEAKLLIATLERRSEALDTSWERAEERLERTKQTARVGAARTLFEAKTELLEREREAAAAMVVFQDADVVAAQARLEQARARQLVRSGLIAEANLLAFDREVNRREEEARGREKEAIALAVARKQAFERVRQAEDALSRSGDFDTLTWID